MSLTVALSKGKLLAGSESLFRRAGFRVLKKGGLRVTMRIKATRGRAAPSP